MLDKITSTLDFQSQALLLRAERQRTIASNIANVDTPGYAARDFDFPSALRDAAAATGGGTTLSTRTGARPGAGTTDPRHIPLSAATTSLAGGGRPSELGYAVQSQPSLDNNTVDIDRERANFADNSVRYEAALRFINGQSRTMLTAIQGQ